MARPELAERLPAIKAPEEAVRFVSAGTRPRIQPDRRNHL